LILLPLAFTTKEVIPSCVASIHTTPSPRQTLMGKAAWICVLDIPFIMEVEDPC
jgi:hypothetical protein